MRINKKTIISIVLCLAAVFMGVGYSILSTNLKITGGANVTSTWDIRITGIINNNATGSAYNLEEPSFTNDTARFRVALVDPGDSMTYTVTIENQGTITAILNSLDITTSGTDAIIYEVTGLKEGDTLAAGETIDVTVVARYNSNVIADPDQRVKTLNVGLEWVQYTNQVITPGTYTIKYNTDGANGTMNDTTCTVGSACTLNTNVVKKTNYKLIGWATSPTGAIVYTSGQTVTNLTSAGKTVTLYAVWKLDTELVSLILKNNTAYADNTTSTYVTGSSGLVFTSVSSDTNGKGLYYTSTNTEGNKPTYYFRGAVTNNIVQFGTDSSGNKLYWKIVRINEDGTIRLIYNGTSATATGSSSVLSSVTAYATTTTARNTYVGYMFGATTNTTYAATHANTTSSKIKTKLDEWYSSNLETNYGQFIADAGFCNDRSLYSGTGIYTTSTVYSGYNRIYTKDTPQFACPTPDNDLFTLNGSSKGNKALTKPIGLLTADEAMYAGAIYNTSNSTYYLYNGVNYWTMTPERYSSGSRIFNVGSTGRIYYTAAGTSSSMYARPVINLKADVKVTDISQLGTSASPYVIDTRIPSGDANKYIINYNSNGGTGSMSNTTCRVGSNCQLATNTFSRTGYTMLGWSTSTTGTAIYSDGQSVKDIESGGYTLTLYAVWQRIGGEFYYTGDVQTYVVPVSGNYKLEVYGAQGGYRSSETYAGLGGYSVGTVYLAKGTTLYIYAGGDGTNNNGYNGGGQAGYSGIYGGGATDIRIGTNSLYARVIVAGGGGSVGASTKKGGVGGGTTGGTTTENYTGQGCSSTACGQGGTQTAGGAGTTNSSYTATAGSFGQGGKGYSLSSGYGGAGGGGWYGGSGSVPDGSGDDDRGGGGGSGFIYTSTATVPSGYLLNSSYYLTNASMTSGVNDSDGYAIITLQ